MCVFVFMCVCSLLSSALQAYLLTWLHYHMSLKCSWHQPRVRQKWNNGIVAVRWDWIYFNQDLSHHLLSCKVNNTGDLLVQYRAIKASLDAAKIITTFLKTNKYPEIDQRSNCSYWSQWWSRSISLESWCCVSLQVCYGFVSSTYICLHVLVF